MQYLAKAYFEGKKYEESRRVLQQALRLEPNNTTLLYNLAVTQHENCISLIKQTKKSRISAQRALNDVINARKYVILFTF